MFEKPSRLSLTFLLVVYVDIASPSRCAPFHRPTSMPALSRLTHTALPSDMFQPTSVLPSTAHVTLGWARPIVAQSIKTMAAANFDGGVKLCKPTD